MTPSTPLGASQEALVFESTPVITFGYIMQVFFSLLIVLAFIYLIGKYLLPRLKTNAFGRYIKVIDRVYLEPQVGAYILKVGKSAWLVAVGKQSIVKIDKIEEESLTINE
ncbi:MAG: flagellar biosynthetic protein FliO [Candidatus Margulisiibacteriota bacterium]|nr:flagellar biosynthetic protein FliO [Candidatus Margulisiibacteriota bacterium]